MIDNYRFVVQKNNLKIIVEHKGTNEESITGMLEIFDDLLRGMGFYYEGIIDVVKGD